jgi:hypothetical protein
MNRLFVNLAAAGVVAAALTGCGAPTAVAVSPMAAPAAGCASTLTTAMPPVEVAARLVEGRVDPAPRRVDVTLGAHVVLRVEADTPTEVHVHGYDREADAAPGTPACLEFVADVPGMFEVEAHPHTLLVQLAVR